MRRAALIVASVVLMATSAAADSARAPDLPDTMVLSKSSNRNEVHYGVFIDGACMPLANAPVHAYWRMRERGPTVTEPLSRREVGWLGVGAQEVSRDSVRFVVRGMPDRSFVAHLGAGPDGACTSWVETTIAGERARLSSIYVKEKLFGVDYVLITGRASNGRVVDERLHP